jgi:uncharacterized protein
MQALIENLVKLQALDLERNRLKQELRALPGETDKAKAALAAAERQSATVSDALSREESLRNRLERETAAHNQKAARFRAQIDAVTTPAQAEAMEHEIRFESGEVERLEDEEYASLERTEKLEAELGAARAEVESLAAALEKTQARVAERRQQFTAELEARNRERDALRALIEPEHLTRYDRLSTLRGTGLARAENQQCTGCRMGVRPQTWNQLREGELLTCDSCGRYLYWDPAMAAAEPTAKLPQSESSAGRTIRKSIHAGD